MLLLELVRELHELNYLLKQVVHLLHNRMKYSVTGGMIFRIGDLMVPISPGNAPKFQVSPTFSGAAFTLDGTKAAIESSDPTNFPVALDLAGDPTGTTFVADIPATATPTGGSEAVVITWTYTNTDGAVATVTGTVTEVGIVDDVTGGTFAQVA
jgi:hypothetical protein